MIVVCLQLLNSSSIHDLTMNKIAVGFALYKKSGWILVDEKWSVGLSFRLPRVRDGRTKNAKFAYSEVWDMRSRAGIFMICFYKLPLQASGCR